MNLIQRAAARTTEAAEAYVPPPIPNGKLGTGLNWRALKSERCPKCGEGLSRGSAGSECRGRTCTFFITTAKLVQIVAKMV